MKTSKLKTRNPLRIGITLNWFHKGCKKWKVVKNLGCKNGKNIYQLSPIAIKGGV